jgi:restriction endonuclease Mrr
MSKTVRHGGDEPSERALKKLAELETAAEILAEEDVPASYLGEIILDVLEREGYR